MSKHLNADNDFEMVEIGRLRASAFNPNQGDLGAIIESIQANGFYGSLVVRRGACDVLAGNYRLAAAKTLGYERLPVTWVDVSDDAAKRILLADNRTARLGNDDPNALAELLAELAGTERGLTGTGFAEEDLQTLLDDLSGPVFNPAGIDQQGRLDEKKKYTCPKCGHEFIPHA